MSSKIITPPSKFVSLHNHTTFSPFDGLGSPDDHFEWCIKNGIPAHAITEHGNMNSYAKAQLLVESWKKNEDKRYSGFKYIPGVEAYYHPDLKQWERDRDAWQDERTRIKEQEKLQKKIIAKTDENDETLEIETSNALVIENEDESKSTKYFNPVNRRHHLVLLPKNEQGLKDVFSAVSWSYINGFYRFPRIDSSVLKRIGKGGNVVASSACLGGVLSFATLRKLQEYKFDELDYKILDNKKILDECITAIGNEYELISESLGKENFYLELQFNKLGAQHVVNRAILEFANRNGLNDKLIVTCDAHYPNPDLWLEREIYKKLGYLNYVDYDPNSLPKSKDDLKCELYPKNAEQIWDEYKKHSHMEFYDDQIVKDAIERAHDVAFDVLGNIKPDRSQKFTKKLVPEETTSFKHLVNLCKQGLEKRNLADKEEYVNRVKYELSIIKQMGFADYFITYQKIMELARKVNLVGPGRGCFTPDTCVKNENNELVPISSLSIGNKVIDAYGDIQTILDVFTYDVDEEILELEFENGTIIKCTKDHKFLTTNRGWVEAQYLTDNDDVKEI